MTKNCQCGNCWTPSLRTGIAELTDDAMAGSRGNASGAARVCVSAAPVDLAGIFDTNVLGSAAISHVDAAFALVVGVAEGHLGVVEIADRLATEQ